MIQILIWAVCILIFGVGYCGRYLEEMLAIQKGSKKTGGMAFLILMVILALGIFALSVSQGIQISNILNR